MPKPGIGTVQYETIMGMQRSPVCNGAFFAKKKDFSTLAPTQRIGATASRRPCIVPGYRPMNRRYPPREDVSRAMPPRRPKNASENNKIVGEALRSYLSGKPPYKTIEAVVSTLEGRDPKKTASPRRDHKRLQRCRHVR